MSIESLFAARLAVDPSSPLITFYDDETGERAELSVRLLANWVAKTHFLLTDELGLQVGDRAFVRLPTHWLAAPILLGCFTAGLEVVTDPSDALVAFADADTVAELDLTGRPHLDEVYAVSLLSMARSSEPPAGAHDYAAAVRPQPDAWAAVRPQGAGSDPALDGLTRDELEAAARQVATANDFADGTRLLWRHAWQPDAMDLGWIPSLLAPLVVRGSTVLVRNPDPGALDRRVASERVTVVL